MEEHDRMLDIASSISAKDRLVSYQHWISTGSPTGQYTGPTPTYQLEFQWEDVEDTGPVQVVNRTMEICFGTRGAAGWKLWVGGDQLVSVLEKFNKEYVQLKEAGDPEAGLLDIWVTNLQEEMERM
jgi:hypothetical protein